MGLFPKLLLPPIAQVGDVVRISASKSFSNGSTPPISEVIITADVDGGSEAIGIIETDPETWFADWVYSSAGTYDVQLELIAAGTPTVTEVITQTFQVVTAAQDALFSSDADLIVIEPEILEWLPKGYSNWNHVHRLSQKNILEWLDEIRLFKADGSAWEAVDLVNRSQVRKLSLYMTLEIIFKSLSNQTDDIYSSKAAYYAEKKTRAMDRNYLDLDVDGDGEIAPDERADLRTVTLVRR